MGARPSSFKKTTEDAAVAVVEPGRVWSPQQRDVFDWFRTGVGNLIVRARAGTGKTTTILEGVTHAPEQNILLAAFSKDIQLEMEKRVQNSNVEVKTLHGLGFNALTRYWRRVKVDAFKRQDNLTNAVVERDTPKPIRALVSKLHTAARDQCVRERDGLVALAEFNNLVPDDVWRDYNLTYVVDQARRACDLAATEETPKDNVIDFADMIFQPLVRGWLNKDYDLVVIDEAQDNSAAQLEMAMQVCYGRICITGDENQALYGFRGADTGSLDRLKAELKATELPLTVTYRCCQAVVREAQKLVPDLQAHASNPEGQISSLNYDDALDAVRPGDFVVSRLNAPLVAMTLELLRKRVRARMLGRDVGAGIRNVLKGLKCYDTMPTGDVLNRIEEWRKKKTTPLAAEGKLDLVDRINDQAGMLNAFACDTATAKEMFDEIESLFVDKEGDAEVILSSIHKIKGKEANRVFVLKESLYRRGPSIEEDNCFYVSITRAKNHLTFVHGSSRAAEKILTYVSN